jgi:hypothetical protein
MTLPASLDLSAGRARLGGHVRVRLWRLGMASTVDPGTHPLRFFAWNVLLELR